MDSLTDEALLGLIARADEDALAALYDRYGKLAYSLAYRVLGNVHDSEDVVQEAFLNVWRMAATFAEKRGTARTWLLAVVHHRSVDMARRRRGQTPRELPLEGELIVAGTHDLWAEVSNNLDRETLADCLGKIPAEQREVVELAYFGGYTQREISELKGIPLGTVKGRVRIAMEKLRRLVPHPEHGGSDGGSDGGPGHEA